MNVGHHSRNGKHPVPRKEFDRPMGLIREQVRHYPQEALEDIFLYLEMIEKNYGVGDSESGGE